MPKLFNLSAPCRPLVRLGIVSADPVVFTSYSRTLMGSFFRACRVEIL
jgi:hypothetical protein